ncbi:ASST-domain-containing protein [Mariannaea sp. PMI_226]|nr:ASST-domain-containing protein [Mariannaea sp. PMI_226]
MISANYLSRPIVSLVGLLILTNCGLFYYLSHARSYSIEREVVPASPATTPTILPSRAYLEVVRPEGPETWPYRVYKSAPFKPPYLQITGNGGDVADGYLFWAPKSRNKVWISEDHPIIMSQENDLVFSLEKAPGRHAFGFNNFRPQIINGTPHLTIWQGSQPLGHGYGDFIIFDDEYMMSKVVLNAKITPNTPKVPLGNLDFHEQEITDRGTVLVTAYNNVPRDLSALGGRKDGWVLDSMFYEIDMETSEIIFSWSAIDHFDFTKSKLPLPCFMGDGSAEKGYDFFHINSIQIVGDAYLVSSRHQWAFYLISQKTGEVLWELNGSGVGGNFGGLAPQAQFRWQHDARAHNISSDGFVLSLFDNHNIPFDTNVTSSRALVLDVRLPPDPTVAPVLLRDLEPQHDLFSNCQGNFIADLSNGNQLVVYGQTPVFREYGPSGDSLDVRSEVRFGTDTGAQTYRAYKSEWKATPRAWAPSLVFENNSTMKGYVSWNGATEVEYWNVYTVSRGAVLESIGRATAHGFETVIDIPRQFNETECLLVAAVQDGVEVRRSNTACLDGL